MRKLFYLKLSVEKKDVDSVRENRIILFFSNYKRINIDLSLQFY